MKINGSQNNKATLQGIESAKNRATEKGGDAKASASADLSELGGSSKVKLSERAQMMQKAKEIATNTNDIDEAKVARLQKLIDEGKYKVDAGAVADRLVDDHLMFPD